MNTKEIVEYAENLTEKDLEWKPLYPNNMLCNRMTGWYCFLWIRNENGTYSGRKYTILFQERENEKGYIEGGNPELFVLFEKIYAELEKPLEYPAPSNTSIFNSESSITFFDINSYGNFVRAFKDVYSAQKRALKQFKMVFGFALSSVVSEKEEEKKI